jgi:hypothetical protein
LRRDGDLLAWIDVGVDRCAIDAVLDAQQQRGGALAVELRRHRQHERLAWQRGVVHAAQRRARIGRVAEQILQVRDVDAHAEVGAAHA